MTSHNDCHKAEMIALPTTIATSNRTTEIAVNISGSYLCVNGSVVPTDRRAEDRTQLDAFLYIIIVLSFYAISMVLLMIKYIRREEEEMSLDYYYTEFVKREHFQQPHIKNRLALERDRQHIDKALLAFDKRDFDASGTRDETTV